MVAIEEKKCGVKFVSCGEGQTGRVAEQMLSLVSRKKSEKCSEFHL